MLLGWPDVEILGITTVADPVGRRAGHVRTFLDLAGRHDIPVAKGAGASLTDGRPMGELPDHERYWNGHPIAPVRTVDAQQLLARDIEAGATVVAIGPATNLGLLELNRPGSLADVPVVMMGGWVEPLADGLPRWGPERDWNVQCDTRAVEKVAATARLTLVPIALTVRTHLRARDLPRLRESGPLGALLARQAQAYAEDTRRRELASEWPGLPDDLLNFHHDPLACAIALGWPGAHCDGVRLQPVLDDGILRFELNDQGRPVTLAVEVDADSFTEVWLQSVEAAQR